MDLLAGNPARSRFNWPAAIVVLLSVCAVPLLLWISWLQAPTTYARHSLDRLGFVAPGTLSSPGALFVFVASNIVHWLGSSVVRQWLWVMIVGTFGTILLRPYYLVVGVPTTVVAWLVNRNDLLWAPRFFSTEALLWCVTLVRFCVRYACRITLDRTRTRTAVLTTAIVVTALCASASTRSGADWLRATRIFFVPLAPTRPRSDKRQTSSSRAIAVKASPTNRWLPQRGFSATRMTEISSG